MQDLRNSLYSHLQFMPLRFFTTTRTGEIQSRIANDVGGVQAVFTDTVSNILSNIVVIVSTLVAMLLCRGSSRCCRCSCSRSSSGSR
jgi:ABC-type multidrug transport system, ATPase and permease components